MRNVSEVAIGIIAAVGFVSAIVSLLTTRWNDASSAVRIRRSMLIGTLLIAAVVAAIVSVPLSPPSVALPLSVTATTATGTNVDTKSFDAAPSTQDVTPSTKTDVVAEPVRRLPPEPVIRDADGRSVPQLVVAAKRAVDITHHFVQGTLSSTTAVESDERLHGLITARMSLDITVTTNGVLTAAFKIDSRGGGSTETAALDQARERLVVTFGERLRQEVPR